MKKFFVIIVAIFATVATADLVVTGLTEVEFDAVFDYNNSTLQSGSDAVWYAQIQAGNVTSTGNNNDDAEMEVGNFSALDTEYGQTSWIGGQTYNFSISNSGGGTVNVSFNSSTTAGLGVGSSFNEIWIGIKTEGLLPSRSLSVTSHSVDVLDNFDNVVETLTLSDMSVSGSPDWTGFKYHIDDRLSNIASFEQSGNLQIVVPHNNAEGTGENFTLTVVGVQNPAIIPEPSILLMFIVGIISVLFVRNKI